MIVCSGLVLLRFPITLCCLVRLVAAIFMGFVCFQVSFFFFYPTFVIRAKPEPFVTIHLEQLLFSSSHTHLFQTRTLVTHTFFRNWVKQNKNKNNIDEEKCQKLYLKFLKELCIRF